SRNGIASPTISEAHIIPTDRIQIPEVEAVIPMQDLVSKALDKRPELQQSRVAIENSRINLTGTKNLLLPQLSVVADLRNNGLTGEPNSIVDPRTGLSVLQTGSANPFFVGGYGNALAQLFGRNFPNYSIGLQLTVPLRNRTAQANLATAELNLRQ